MKHLSVNRCTAAALLLTAGCYAAGAWADEARELRMPVREAALSHAFKAPEHASYSTELVGFVYYAESWNNLPDDEYTPMGIYTIPTERGGQPEPYAMIGKASSHCNGGVVLAGDTFWYIWRQTDPTGTSGLDISQLYSYNLTTGQYKAHGAVSSELASNSAKAWDPVEKVVYGQYDINGARTLCITDYEEQTVTPIAQCSVYMAMACDASGVMYGIDAAGGLYKIDKKTAKGEYIGSTGVTPKYVQSMAFDYHTGDLYWASYTDGNQPSVLYRVDTATAKVETITVFTDRQEILGLGVMPALCADGAPGYATDLKLTTDKASVKCVVSFTLPEYTYMGEKLSEKIDWTVRANGNVVISGNGMPGDAVSKEVTLPEGSVSLTVTCAGSQGEGPAAELVRWVGEGYPLSPENVKLSVDESKGLMSVTWDAVTEGVDGGYVDPAKVTYNVVAYPGARKVAVGIAATQFTETLAEPEIPVDTWYEVVACNDWRESEPVATNHYPWGRGFEVPYNNSFDKPADLALFYIIDGNGDNATWTWSQYSGQTAYIFTGTDADGDQDDWLITPGIDMKAGNNYKLTYYTNGNASGGTGRFTDMLEIAFGKGVTPTDYEVAQEKFVYNTAERVRYEVVVTPATDGYYHFGFHAVSNCKKGLAMNIDDINIDVMANSGAPAAPQNLTCRTSQGTAPVSLSFNLPTKTVGGDKLESITKVELWRNTSELVKTVENPTPGAKLTMVDNKGSKGATQYSVVAYNEAGIGERATAEVFLGLDLPSGPEDIVLTDNGKGGYKLTWKAPESGANGGYVNPSNLRYNIYRVTSGYAVEYKMDVTGTELDIPVWQDYYASSQDLLQFAVTAVNSVGESGMYISTEVVTGRPYTYPFAESWRSGRPTYDLWYRANSGANGWNIATTASSDNDGGCMAFPAAKDGDMSYLYLGKVDMSTAKEPKLIFDYYCVPGADASLGIDVNKAFKDGWEHTCTLDFKNADGEKGWREGMIDLSEFKNYPYITTRFLGKTTATTPLYIDNVRIMDANGVYVNEIDATLVDVVAIYDLSGRRVATPQNGSVYIVKYSDGTVKKLML